MDCTIRVAKTKALINLTVTAKLICIFVFAYTKSQFSHDVTQIRLSGKPLNIELSFERHCEKTRFLHMRKQKRRSAAQSLRS